MAFLSLTLNDSANRWANVIVGVVWIGLSLSDLFTYLTKLSAYSAYSILMWLSGRVGYCIDCLVCMKVQTERVKSPSARVQMLLRIVRTGIHTQKHLTIMWLRMLLRLRLAAHENSMIEIILKEKASLVRLSLELMPVSPEFPAVEEKYHPCWADHSVHSESY
jgi:hypothetical protein